MNAGLLGCRLFSSLLDRVSFSLELQRIPREVSEGHSGHKPTPIVGLCAVGGVPLASLCQGLLEHPFVDGGDICIICVYIHNKHE